MATHDDPFEISVREVQSLVSQAKHIERLISDRGVVSASHISELRTIIEDAEEVLELIREGVRVVEDQGGRVQRKVFSANEMVDRQNTLRSLEKSVGEVSRFFHSAERRCAEIMTAEVAPHRGRLADDFVVAQELAQVQEQQQQDEVLDRLAFGLNEMRETGTNINDELSRQEIILSDMDSSIGRVQVHLRQANERVDQLLASLSNSGKFCTIFALVAVLVILLWFMF